MIVGLTGGMGSGKSTVGRFFKNLGVPVYDSDSEAKRLMVSSEKIKKAIIELLGEGAYSGENLEREYIAQRIFRDKELLKKLNGIVHPAVREDFLKWVEEQDHPYVIQETALLFENGMRGFYDKIVLVTAPKEIRIKRILNRDKTTRSEVLARLKNQMDDFGKISFSDFRIENIELADTKLKIAKLNDVLLEFC
ncbi:dephospho-CoA kinase [Maribacter sp. 2304DJ31-5]|uniref:dephospho-CoA kinase n=1 Tax=Maribacter sp. 2304DJ31-5 TaxID=3386273 RepID=UPI0039BD1A8C